MVRNILHKVIYLAKLAETMENGERKMQREDRGNSAVDTTEIDNLTFLTDDDVTPDASDYERAVRTLLQEESEEFQDIYENMEFYKKVSEEKQALNIAVIKEFHQSLGIEFVGTNMTFHVNDSCANTIEKDMSEEYDIFRKSEYKKIDVQRGFLKVFLQSTVSLVQNGIVSDVKKEAYEEKLNSILRSRFGVSKEELLGLEEQEELMSLMSEQNNVPEYQKKMDEYYNIILDACSNLNVDFTKGFPILDVSFYEKEDSAQDEYIYKYIPMEEIKKSIFEELKKSNILLKSVTTKERIQELLCSPSFKQNFKECVANYDRHVITYLFVSYKIYDIMRREKLTHLETYLTTGMSK